MNDERPPAPAVKSYAGGIHARSAQRAEERRQGSVLPNLGQAAVSYSPKDGPMTIAQMGEEQRVDAAEPEPRQGQLSPETVKGMQALHEAQEEARKKQGRSADAAAEAPPKVRGDSQPLGADEEIESELEWMEALRGARRDSIQNDAERAAVAKRCGEIDLAQGLLDGQFKQRVPIVPNKLEVTFRCLTPGENNELRLFVFDEIRADPRKTQIGQDLLALYQTIATVLQINETAFIPHMVPEGQFGRLVFSKEFFEQKVAQFMNYPLPLIASLGTHSGWFEMRVRDLFTTTDRLKNG